MIENYFLGLFYDYKNDRLVLIEDYLISYSFFKITYTVDGIKYYTVELSYDYLNDDREFYYLKLSNNCLLESYYEN